MPKAAKGSKVMKGRPITEPEFQRMLDATPDVVGKENAEAWQFYLRGMWWSGLRLSESLQLYWDRDRQDRLCIDFDLARPLLWIPAEFDKGKKDRVHPVAPGFVSHLQQVPAKDRTGPVFRFPGHRGALPRADWVSKFVCAIGQKADVVVDTDPHTSKKKYACLHDLRRSFGQRWQISYCRSN
ncbi:tyrosine-type recombinase/integrase [Blastopirellula sp. J2-11]|uniref:tyrosine-type recombinase/integrase n=1 Tax=Blastopirellula sp. J2-11 TaxID=2943192 RepID=UPI0021C6ED21|nr:tyrosine-type recombinase/integrase [Blastopirellula sp. J2-11]UUO08409.1 tyrosine-type recombinase/integrase [Blastopirellula sp. J2-11]